MGRNVVGCLLILVLALVALLTSSPGDATAFTPGSPACGLPVHACDR